MSARGKKLTVLSSTQCRTAGNDLLEVLGRDFTLGTKVLVHENQRGCQQAEKQTESKDDKVTNTLGDGRLTSKVGGLASKLGKRWNDIVFFHLDNVFDCRYLS